MIAENGLSKVIDIDMRVDLGRCNGLVSQHLLNQAQVGTVLQQVRRKRMTKSVRADILLNTGFRGEAFDDGEDHRAGELTTVVIDKNDIAKFGLHIDMHPFLEPPLIPFLRFGRDRNQSLLTALTGHNQISLLEKDIADFEINEFGHTQAAAVQYLQDSTIACSFVRGVIDSVHQLIDFVQRQHLRQVVFGLGTLNKFRRVLRNIIVVEQEAVERTNTGQNTCLRLCIEVLAESDADKILQVVESHVHDIQSPLVAVFTQFGQVHLISLHRIDGKAPFQT